MGYCFWHKRCLYMVNGKAARIACMYRECAARVPVPQGMAGQVIIQAKGVLITVVWSGVVSFVLFKLIDMTIGLRVSEEEEREGLDTASHGERAYNL